MDAIETMLSWLRREGALFEKLGIRVTSSGDRTIVATTNIAAQELLVEVPGRLLMTRDTALASPIGREIDAAKLPLNSDDVLTAVWLLEERGRADSPWAPFFATLPASMPSFALSYGAAELAWLKGSSLLVNLEEHRANMEEDDEHLRAAIPAYRRFELNDLVWARCILWSRRFGGDIDGKQIAALVPGADMVNHRPGSALVWAVQAAGDTLAFRAAPSRAIRKGDEIFTSYGRKSNRELLVQYGFLDGDDSSDTSALVIGLPDSLPDASRKRTMLMGRDDPSALFRFNLCVPRNEKESVAHAELFSFLRLAHATREEVDDIVATQKVPTSLGPIGAANEAAALGGLEAACRRTLDGFETSRDEDEKLLRTGELDVNARHCVMYRRGEKRLLRYYIDHAKKVRARIERSPDAFAAQLKTAHA